MSWPGGWKSGARMRAEQDVSVDDEPTMTLDHGTLYLVGDKQNGDEWLFMTGDWPTNRC